MTDSEIIEQEYSSEEVKEVIGEYLPSGTQKNKVFFDDNDCTAYNKLLQFLNWRKPQAFSVQSGDIEGGQRVIKVDYII